MADIFDVIAEPTRRALLQALRDRLDAGESTVAVAELVEASGATRQTVNRQLATLLEANLVRVVDDAPHRTYALDTTPLEEIEDWLAPFVGLAPQQAAPVSTVFSAWSGTDAGDLIGRGVADRTFRARSAVANAAAAVRNRIGDHS